MAHEIDFTNTSTGAAMFAYQPAWHRHGVTVAEAQTSEDALRIANLDWAVGLCDLNAVLPDGTTRKVPTHRATYRTDTGAPLGAVGLRYRPLQNRDAFDWMDQIVGEKLAIWHTCGSLRGGRQVWMLCKLPGTVAVTDADILEKYVLVTNRHDGLGAVSLMPTSVRVVCANTLRLAMSTRTCELRLRHTEGSLARKVEKAKEALGVINEAHEQFGVASRVMMSKKLTSAEVAGYFANVADGKADKARAKLLTALWDRFALPTNEGTFGANVWTAYNAVSEYADHELRVIGKGEQRAERKFASTLFGTAHALKEKAWAIAATLAV